MVVVHILAHTLMVLRLGIMPVEADYTWYVSIAANQVAPISNAGELT